MAWRAATEAFDCPRKTIEHLEQLAAAMDKIQTRQFPDRIQSARDELRNGKGAVIGRAQHQSFPPLTHRSACRRI